ncbi:SDR family oxidoreductase [Alteromonas sediminis]|uniref:SDR family oxidoreductase n=1 Tax=Alteromonas sediminis TaxID=2259342 RepID=A0A3N5Z954_9ALTE|nr:SDR family NAD(P)-dependent oxidoreductase [Alteromonas sediminis]RPJ67494.1 SDR family oxidoreductase [Alteromonas sediminis]
MTAANVDKKHILITGGGSGIGEAAAKLLAARGATVGVADINTENADKVVAQISADGHDAYSLTVDVSDKAQVEQMYQSAVSKAGVINVVINNAGVDHIPAPMHEVDDQAYMKNIAVNLNGVWFSMKNAIGHMLQNSGGHIINVASVAGLRSAPSVSAYSATKHAVVGLTKSAAVEYARANIRVNAVCPSFIDTPMVQGVLKHLPEKQQRGIIGANPMKRLGTVDEVAGAIAWLCSDESTFVTGQSMVLDGGMLA